MGSLPAYNVKNVLQGFSHEKIYRRKSSGNCYLHNRKQCHRPPGGKTIWHIEKYRTYGCNNIERWKGKVVWVVE